MMLEFTAGINTAGKRESVTVAAEDALIAALKVKYERPDAVINYVRQETPVQDSNLQPDRYGATRPRSGSSRPSRARRGGKIALSIPAPEGERFIA